MSLCSKVPESLKSINRALDKSEYSLIIRDNFCKFCIKTYIVTPHLNRLDERVQKRVTTYGFDEK